MGPAPSEYAWTRSTQPCSAPVAHVAPLRWLEHRRTRRITMSLGLSLILLCCSHAARVPATTLAHATAATGTLAPSASAKAGTAAEPSVVPSASTEPQLQAPTPPEPPIEDEPEAATLEEQRERLLRRMREQLLLSEDAMRGLRSVLMNARYAGQGNPAVTEHPMTRRECRERRTEAKLPYYTMQPPCAALNMVPLYNRKAGESAKDAHVCIDQYEFPNLACEYPLVHAKAVEAAAMCKAVGKRLCDAHEWEGACAGSLLPPEEEYAWGRDRQQMKWFARNKREIVWAYGATRDHSKCATGGQQSRRCLASNWKTCGSNTFPAGAYPECVSVFGVYDQHGNAAEHMNMPMRPEELTSRGGYGETEMKGSWFIAASRDLYPDDCRWRAPDWHVSKVMDPDSHSNYHLGFRCCQDVVGTK